MYPFIIFKTRCFNGVLENKTQPDLRLESSHRRRESGEILYLIERNARPVKIVCRHPP